MLTGAEGGLKEAGPQHFHPAFTHLGLQSVKVLRRFQGQSLVAIEVEELELQPERIELAVPGAHEDLPIDDHRRPVDRALDRQAA